jgi:hypothetical protein
MRLDTTATRYVLSSIHNYLSYCDSSVSCRDALYCSPVLPITPPLDFILKAYFCIWQWAEVLSADAFSAFEDAGLDDSKVCQKMLSGRTGILYSCNLP